MVTIDAPSYQPESPTGCSGIGGSLTAAAVIAHVIQQRQQAKLGVHNLSLTLQVWRYVGDPPLPGEFLNRLVVDPEDSVHKEENPNPRVDLMSIEISELAETEEPNEAFAAELEGRLMNIAHWLEKQPVDVFSSLRENGFFTNLLFTGWIDCDQLDLDLPPALLLACGRLGLKISVITND